MNSEVYPRYEELAAIIFAKKVTALENYNVSQISATITSLFKHPDSKIHEKEIMALITYHWTRVDGGNIYEIPYGGKYHFADTKKFYHNAFKNFPPFLCCIICEYILSQA
jgi:hypothetical protein